MHELGYKITGSDIIKETEMKRWRAAVKVENTGMNAAMGRQFIWDPNPS